jgi:PAS domain S-box-containing protein
MTEFLILGFMKKLNNKSFIGLPEDVSDLNAAETALIKSQELYSDLVSNISDGIYRILVLKPQKGKSIIESTFIEFVSDRFCELFEVEKEEFLKDTIASTIKRIHPDDLTEFIKSNETAQKLLVPYVREIRLLINNRIKWLRFESSPRNFEDGSTRWTGVVADITEHKLSGVTLNISEERQKFIFESLPIAVYSSQLDPGNGVSWISGNVREITGFEKEEYITKKDFWRMRLHPDDKDRVKNAFINFPQNGEMIIEYRWKCRDNQYHWFQDKSVLLVSDAQQSFLGVIADITERKHAEASIRISEEKYYMLLELATDAFFQGDKNGNFITVNSVAIDQTGYSRDELLKMNMKTLFSEETLLDKPLNYDRLIKGEVVISERELIRKNQKKIIVEMNSRMMPDGTFQSFFRDITQRKITENALKRKLTELQIYYELAISRERKMIALKSEINLLLERLGEKLKY